MKTSVENINPTHVKLTITVEPEALKPHIDAAYKTIASQIAVPGFRRGKVPAPIIDNRVGRGAVLEQAISDGLDEFYRQALSEHSLQPLSRPQADIAKTPEPKDFSGDLVVEVEVDIRPEVALPEWQGLKIEVDPAEVTDDDVEAALTELRERFGTLTSVDRPLEEGDFATLDLVAKIDGEVIDEASDISYEVGSGELLEGTDEAILTLTAGEETSFRSTLLGGDHEGEQAEVTVKVTAVKERELPEVDEDFVQMASEFDTVDELRDDLREQAAQRKRTDQVEQARKKAIDTLIELAEIPVPAALIDEEVSHHLEEEGKSADDPHGDEVRTDAEHRFREQLVLDEITKAEDVQVEQEEFTQYLMQTASRYGVSPQEYIEFAQKNDQLPQIVGEVARAKAALYVLDAAEVVDTEGNPVDLSEYTEVVRRAKQQQAEQAAQAAAQVAAEADTESTASTADVPAAEADSAAASAEADSAETDSPEAAKESPPAAPRRGHPASGDPGGHGAARSANLRRRRTAEGRPSRLR